MNIYRKLKRYLGSRATDVRHAVWIIWLQLTCFGRSSSIVRRDGPVVSLTTHGSRINTVHFVIKTIARGTLLPSRIILWIDDEKLFKELPSSLERLKKRGLEVQLCDNFGPHTKYYPYLESATAFHAPLVTADDDILYPRWWLANLSKAFIDFPEHINCYRARVMALSENRIAEYGHWHLCNSTTASFLHFGTGVSGVIYPPRFQEHLKGVGNAFLNCCPKADDLWLHVQAIRSGFRIRQIGCQALHFAIIPGTQRTGLYNSNFVSSDGNDQQVKATYSSSDVGVLLQEVT